MSLRRAAGAVPIRDPGRGQFADRLALPIGALSAYFLKGVVPEWDLEDIYAGMLQIMVIQITGLMLIIFFPQIALWLPGVMYGD